jgi:hypothetical protein
MEYEASRQEIRILRPLFREAKTIAFARVIINLPSQWVLQGCSVLEINHGVRTGGRWQDNFCKWNNTTAPGSDCAILHARVASPVLSWGSRVGAPEAARHLQPILRRTIRFFSYVRAGRFAGVEYRGWRLGCRLSRCQRSALLQPIQNLRRPQER